MFNILTIFRSLRRSYQWRKVRNNFIQDFPTCAACGKGKNLQVHHIVPVSVDPTKELDYNNLITLCASPCHLLFGHLNNYRSYNVDVVKDCAYFLNKIRNRPINEYKEKHIGCNTGADR